MDGIFTSSGVWFLIGAILVWFMQAGFAMVETGFTRARWCSFCSAQGF